MKLQIADSRAAKAGGPRLGGRKAALCSPSQNRETAFLRRYNAASGECGARVLPLPFRFRCAGRIPVKARHE